jgi:hypothetical protein
MRIALCIAGFLRSFEYTIAIWNYRLRNFNTDVFIFAPNIYNTPLEENTYDAQKSEFINLNLISSAFGSKLKVIQLYDYNSQKYKEIIKNNNIPTLNKFDQFTYRILSMHYNIQEVSKLQQNYSNNYDLVMISRADLDIYSDFDFSALNLDYINYPKFHGISPQGNRKEGAAAVVGTNFGFNDQMFVGIPENMKIFNNIYDKIPEYYKDNIEINSETLLGYHCINNNIKFEGTDFITYDILRQAKQYF